MNDEDSLMQRARRLPGEIPPRRDLWSDIEARLRAPEPATAAGAGWRWFGLAAAASVIMAVAALTVLHTDRQPTLPAPAPVAVSTDFPAPFGPAYSLGPQYQVARAGLAQDLNSRLAALPPETRASVLRNLEAIRAAVAEINAALADDPGNVLLQQLLLTTYQDELAVLADVQDATEKLPKRNEI